MSQLNIIVTGGFGELGSAVAEALSQQGHKVCRVDFAAAPSEKSHDMLDLAGIDLSKAKDCDQVITRVTEAFDGIDVLLNIAGGFSWATFEEAPISSWERMNAMNLLTAVTMTKLAMPEIRKSAAGRIINMGALGALSADAGLSAYAASKAGIHRFTEALSKELLHTPVTVNAILPSIIDTQANRNSMPDADTNQWVTPNSIAEIISFLISPAARSISGALIPVSKGG
jgi:NAD(P)-dependent dehydrogenase (short-subunit alcohol dehydrogenase family)